MPDTFELGADNLYRCRAFYPFSWQQHAFGTRLMNPSAKITLKQIHSDRVLNAASLTDHHAAGDALVTNQPGCQIAVRTADCIPLLLLDSSQKSVAAVHAGWRGTASRIAERAIERMSNDFLTQSHDILAAIGPCIRSCCYQVGPDVAAQFEQWDAVDQNRHVDLPFAITRQLIGRGVPADRIFDSGLCTFCSPQLLYSYRRDPADPGRMLSAIGLI